MLKAYHSRFLAVLVGSGAAFIVAGLIHDRVPAADNPPTSPRTAFQSRAKPKLLVAPFGVDDARAARKAWAKYLQIDEQRTNLIGVSLTLIPAGEFQMGSAADGIDKVIRSGSHIVEDNHGDEQPQHRVRITHPFFLGTYEVTKGHFKKFVEETGYQTEAERDGAGAWGYTSEKDSSFPFAPRPTFSWRDWGLDQSDDAPVVDVSHNDAVAFCKWLSKKEGQTYRLPTEAEWEYACRAGTTSLYYSGNDPQTLTKIGNVANSGAKKAFPTLNWTAAGSDGWALTSTVGQFQPNNFGLYDMIGNAWEWCADWYDERYYSHSPLPDPSGPQVGYFRVTRGGSWGDPAWHYRSADRSFNTPSYRDYRVGFRLALIVSGQ
jgi:formylglycine-generating enzyme